MSIQTEIERIENNIAATYAELEEQGATMPSVLNSDNLATAAATTKTVKYISQSLTDAQKTQARTNISAASSADITNLNTALNSKLNTSGGTLTGTLTINNGATAQKSQPYLQWATIGSNKPYTGFAHDQTDGTFIICSMEKDTTTNGVKYYKNGLAIGGGSGNLFWKGAAVATVNDITLDKLGVTATAAELNYVDGVTSNIQIQLNAKAGTAVATTTSNGLMSATDKTNLNNAITKLEDIVSAEGAVLYNTTQALAETEKERARNNIEALGIYGASSDPSAMTAGQTLASNMVYFIYEESETEGEI